MKKSDFVFFQTTITRDEVNLLDPNSVYDILRGVYQKSRFKNNYKRLMIFNPSITYLIIK